MPCPYCSRRMVCFDGIMGAAYICRACELTIDRDDIRTVIYDY